MLDDVIEVLRCPHCSKPLSHVERALACESGHHFDVARQGFVSLVRRPSALRADTRDMVLARQAFLAGGHYDVIADSLAEALATTLETGCIADVGSGPGFYLNRCLQRRPGCTGLALDLSPYAARLAARAHPRLGSVVCDATDGLPVQDGALAAVLSIFAPRNGPEIVRVLRPGGVFVVVVPDDEHLREIRKALGLLEVGRDKSERIERAVVPPLRLERTVPIKTTVRLRAEELSHLALMGPAAWHRSPAQMALDVAAMPTETAVSISVELRIYRAPT